MTVDANIANLHMEPTMRPKCHWAFWNNRESDETYNDTSKRKEKH